MNGFVPLTTPASRWLDPAHRDLLKRQEEIARALASQAVLRPSCACRACRQMVTTLAVPTCDQVEHYCRPCLSRLEQQVRLDLAAYLDDLEVDAAMRIALARARRSIRARLRLSTRRAVPTG